MTDLRALIEANRSSEGPAGLPCFCTANEHVLRAVLRHAAHTGVPAVVEATCNQVNQEGGYTGLTPAAYMARLRGMAEEAGVPAGRLTLGGDHLGPNPWRREPAARAMDRAREMVRLYAEAGFTKLHLDASMALGGEAQPSVALIAERAADLCAVAEAHAPDPSRLVYVVGTEVPVPGGETEAPAALDVTPPERLRETIEAHREAFAARGLDAAWARVVAVVAQPGVDFSHSAVHVFDPEAAGPLSRAILAEPGLAFEAHSTDYQPTAALRALVDHHFALLKVGPELTFRFREAVFALAEIERLMAPPRPSRLREVVTRRMDEAPGHWREHYHGTREEVALLREHGYSDRIRYYWADPGVAEALGRLIANLRDAPPPETVVSQHFQGLDFGAIPTDPEALIEGHVGRCVGRYVAACGAGEV